MAAVDLTSQYLPVVHEKTNVGTTLQEFILPPGTRQVTVQVSAAAYVQFDTSATAPSDGDAVSSTTRWSIPTANGSAGWAIAPGKARSVFVAAQAATCTVWVSCEESP